MMLRGASARRPDQRCRELKQRDRAGGPDQRRRADRV